MRTLPKTILLPLLAATGLLALGACAEIGDPPRPMATITPLELVGLTVQSTDGTRILGTVDDVVVTPDRRPAQLVVASGAPLHPTERRATVDAGLMRYSSERQALILSGMTTDEFVALPATVRGDQAATPQLSGATGSTNWSGVRTVPR